MAKKFTVDDILGSQSRAAAPAGQQMDIVMLPIADIQPNPRNDIYDIGDVSMLKADIADHGLRTPLEVCPAGEQYMLVAGHRRWTACRQLYQAGDERFSRLPAVIREYGSEDEELVALITSNATARELTDGERLRQYVELKGALTRLKAAGKVEGRVREELTRRTGEGAGTLGRLNAIAARCVPEVLKMLMRGEITATRAYECSRLYKVQQVDYAKTGRAALPSFTPEQRAAVIEWLVHDEMADILRGVPWLRVTAWSYMDSLGEWTLDDAPTQIDCVGLVQVSRHGSFALKFRLIDPADHDEVLAETTVALSELYTPARALYVSDDDIAAEQKRKADADAEKKARKDETEKWFALAGEQLARFDEWENVAEIKALGLTFRRYPLADGGCLVVGVDELTRLQRGDYGLPYQWHIRACFDAEGRRREVWPGDEWTGWVDDERLSYLIVHDLKARQGGIV